MDLRLQANPQLHYGINGAAGRNSRQHEDDLRFLSQEEQECIQFFEETIDSLEESLEENDPRLEQRISRSLVEGVNGPPTSSPNPGVTVSSFLARPPSPKDQDIIDLVRPKPDLVQTKERHFSPTNPDFQSMPTPESHFEIKPRRDQTDSLPSEYNPPLPSGSYGPTDSHSAYHPPGCIPTPVLIAQQIAENQAGGTSNFLPSSLLRHCSLDSTDGPIVKQGPPTSAKPSRYPSNINVILGNKEHHNQSLANVNIQERQTQMLANLSGSHPLLQEDPQQSIEQKARNVPTRSISFKDPSPDKSRMEALSKLGLNRNRAMSGGMSLLVTPNSTSLDPSTGAETNAKPLKASASLTTETSTKLPEATVRSPSQIYEDRKAEILRRDSLRSNEDRNRQVSPSPPAVTQGSFYPPPPLDTKTSIPPAPEVTSLESNSYGGKSIMVNPSVSSRSEPPTSQTSHEPKIFPPALANPIEFNPYGGKTKVMTPAAVTRSDLPDILSSHIDKSQTLPAKSEPLPTELNSYGGKSRTINPSTGLNRPSKSFKPPAPTPAQKPPRHSYHGAVTSQKAASRALSPEHKRRPSSMFRPQGITVQFSGRGATDESRRDALRKLGLLKDS
ncbi:proline and serine-rich protein 2 [Morone saxatilis]|uniref:proline and serine-rich protein 2 n=1 Tax=Morone saxatilis TaxID=34816 RepID=UPI0015E1CC92|nr:proline and serine-rich protein 2 [Morone saxatilis]